MLLQLRQDVDYLKQVVANAGVAPVPSPLQGIPAPEVGDAPVEHAWQHGGAPQPEMEDPEEQTIEEENLSIEASNLSLIERVLDKHAGNRKEAAKELGISERTLYRKLNKIRK